MDQTEVRNSAEIDEAIPAEMPPIDEAEIRRQVAEWEARLRSEHNLPLGTAAGFVAAALGAGLWAIVTVATKFQIGWMAVGIGFLVGYAVQRFGKGTTKIFGIVGAGLALFGCVLGNLLSACGLAAADANVPFLDIALPVFTHPMLALHFLGAMFSPMDLLFYGIALMEGYKLSFRKLTEEDLGKMNG